METFYESCFRDYQFSWYTFPFKKHNTFTITIAVEPEWCIKAINVKLT